MASPQKHHTGPSHALPAKRGGHPVEGSKSASWTGTLALDGTRRPCQQLRQLATHRALQRNGCGARKLRSGKCSAQPHQMHPGRQRAGVSRLQGMNLPPNGIARDGSPGPTLGRHSAQPDATGRAEQRQPWMAGSFRTRQQLLRRRPRQVMPGEMRAARHRRNAQQCLELGPCFQAAPSHRRGWPGSIARCTVFCSDRQSGRHRSPLAR